MRDSFDQDSEEGLLSKESTDGSEPSRYTHEKASSRWWHRRPQQSSLVTKTILALSLSNTVTIGFCLLLLLRSEKPVAAVNHPPTGVAPTMAHLIEKPTPKILNTTFYDYGDNWFRKHDSVEAYQRWIDYDQSEAGFIMIPREDAEKADIDPNRHAYIDRPDLGMVGYATIPEAMHQMHCVNALRMNLWYNIEHTRKNCKQCVLKEPYATLHIDHCVEILRKRIECTADLGLVPFMWVGTEGRITGDGARMHTCSNYEAVRQFVAENSVPVPHDGVLKYPPGAPYDETYI